MAAEAVLGLAANYERGGDSDSEGPSTPNGGAAAGKDGPPSALVGAVFSGSSALPWHAAPSFLRSPLLPLVPGSPLRRWRADGGPRDPRGQVLNDLSVEVEQLATRLLDEAPSSAPILLTQDTPERNLERLDLPLRVGRLRSRCGCSFTSRAEHCLSPVCSRRTRSGEAEDRPQVAGAAATSPAWVDDLHRGPRVERSSLAVG